MTNNGRLSAAARAQYDQGNPYKPENWLSTAADRAITPEQAAAERRREATSQQLMMDRQNDGLDGAFDGKYNGRPLADVPRIRQAEEGAVKREVALEAFRQSKPDYYDALMGGQEKWASGINDVNSQRDNTINQVAGQRRDYSKNIQDIRDLKDSITVEQARVDKRLAQNPYKQLPPGELARLQQYKAAWKPEYDQTLSDEDDPRYELGQGLVTGSQMRKRKEFDEDNEITKRYADQLKTQQAGLAKFHEADRAFAGPVAREPAGPPRPNNTYNITAGAQGRPREVRSLFNGITSPTGTIRADRPLTKRS